MSTNKETAIVDSKLLSKKIKILEKKMRSFIVSCSLAALVCVLIGSTEAALYQEDCPSTMTPEQCKAYAEKTHKEKNDCVRHEVSGLHIEWADCGRVICGENTREVDADLSKSYPDCCPRCEVIDPSKPATSMAVGK